MRHGNSQSRADRDELPSDSEREVTSERELLPQVAQHTEHGVLPELVSAIWRVLRGMGIADDDVAVATRISFDQAFSELAAHAESTASTLAGLPGEQVHVIDPLFSAAYRAARAGWQPLVAGSAGELSASSVRFQGELLVLGLLGLLDEAKRSSLLLADMEQLSSPEISSLTGVRLDVVYDELRKARKAFERARKRYDQAGATVDSELDTRELLALARQRFSPTPAALASLCDELSERFDATQSLRPLPGPESAA